MVTLIINNTTVELEKTTYTLKSKISGYLADDIDRSKMKLNILPFVKTVFCVEIKETLFKAVLYKVDLCPNSKIEEPSVSLELLYKTIKNFTLENESKKLLLDKNYNIIGFENSGRDYTPYRLEEKELLEANVTNSYPFLEITQKDTEEYFLLAFPDLLISVDRYTAEAYLGIMVKNYIDSRFPILDKDSSDKRSISLPAFQLIYAHMKSILNVKSPLNYSVKACYDNMNRMNLLSKIPYENFWITGLELNLKTDRLKEMLSKKESLVEKIKGIINDKNTKDTEEINKNKFNDEVDIIIAKDCGDDCDVDDKDKLIKITNNNNDEEEAIIYDIPIIPDYFSHAFDENSVCMLWTDFIDDYGEWESTNVSPLNSFGEEFLAESAIIIPEEGIGTVEKDEINFMGFDGDKFYISINSKLQGKEELELRNKIATYFQRKFNHAIDIVFDEIIDVKENNTQLSLLPNNKYDDIDYGIGE